MIATPFCIYVANRSESKDEAWMVVCAIGSRSFYDYSDSFSWTDVDYGAILVGDWQ